MTGIWGFQFDVGHGALTQNQYASKKKKKERPLVPVGKVLSSLVPVGSVTNRDALGILICNQGLKRLQTRIKDEFPVLLAYG